MIAKLTAVVCFIFHATVGHSMAGWNAVKAGGLQQKLKHFTVGHSMIILDGDNIRGKTRFKLSKEELCMKVEEWISRNGMYGKVTLMYDHATQHSGYFIAKSGLAVVFSGPSRTADDVISRDVPWLQRILHSDVTLITEDCGLKRRCKRSSRGIIPEKRRELVRPRKQDKDEKQNGNEDEKIRSVEKRLHFIGSLPFANMIMGMNIPQSLLPTDVSVARTADSDTYEHPNEDQEIIEDSDILLSDSVPRNILGNVLSSEDMIVTRSNALLIARRKEDELRTQLAGIQAAISKSEKNIAPKLYVRIKDIKRKINALELYRDPIHSDSIIEEISQKKSITEEEIEAEKLANFSSDLNLSKKSTNLQPKSVTLDQKEPSNEGDTDSNGLQDNMDLYLDDKNEEGNENENENMNGNSRKSKENKKKISRTILKLREKNNREEYMLKKADALLVGINVRIGVEGRPVEQTWERVILAEKMRIELSRNCISKIDNNVALEDGEISLSCGELYVKYINRNYNLHYRNIL